MNFFRLVNYLPPRPPPPTSTSFMTSTGLERAEQRLKIWLHMVARSDLFFCLFLKDFVSSYCLELLAFLKQFMALKRFFLTSYISCLFLKLSFPRERERCFFLLIYAEGCFQEIENSCLAFQIK